MLFQPPLSTAYAGLSTQEMDRRIRAHKTAFGKRLVILGHHYQQDDVIQYADFTGDSLKLSQLAGQQKDAEFVVFCGVHFMAESADIICNRSSPPSQVADSPWRGGGRGGPKGDDVGALSDEHVSALAQADGADALATSQNRVDVTRGSAREAFSPSRPPPSPPWQGGASAEVVVILPDLSAGCSMADMAAIEQLEDAWDHLTGITDAKIIPITYVNSTAAVKAFCGQHDGACCTSSNARKVLEWALTQGDKVLFLPDQHLGRNTAYAMGYPLDSMIVYDPHEEHSAVSSQQSASPPLNKSPQVTRRGEGGVGGVGRAIATDSPLTVDQIRDAKFYLWKGHCSVHGLFTEKQVDDIRAKDAACKVLVHPECKWEVVQKSDLAGSTEYIIRVLDDSPPGSHWAVGTEMHLVNRLAVKYAGTKSIRSLAGMQCLCTTMYRIDQKHLLWVLDELAAGRVVNRIRVDDDTRHWALVALQRMLDNVPAVPIAAK